MRSDLPLDALRAPSRRGRRRRLRPLDDAIALFEGRRDACRALELRRDPASAVPVEIDVGVSDFAAGEVGGYAVRALRGLRAVVGGGGPEPFEFR